MKKRFVLWCCLAGILLAAGRLSAQQTPIIFKQGMQELPRLDSLSHEDLRTVTRQLARACTELRDTTDRRLTVAHRQSELSAQSLDAARQDTTLPKSQLKSLETTHKQLIKREKAAQQIQEKALVLDVAVYQLQEADSVQIKKQLPKFFKQYRQITSALEPVPAKKETPVEPIAAATKPTPSTPDTAAAPSGKNKKIKLKKARAEEPPTTVVDTPLASTDADTTAPAAARTKKVKEKKTEKEAQVAPSGPQYAKYTTTNDVQYNPIAPPCVFAQESRDEFTGEISRETESEELFRSTPAALKGYLQGKPHVVATAALGAKGSNYYLHVVFEINDPNVRKSFGVLPKNSQATLRLLDGTNLALTNQRLDEGFNDAERERFFYHGFFPLDDFMLKKLRSEGLDALRVSWSTGYEDYDIQHVDLLRRQLKCLEKK